MLKELLKCPECGFISKDLNLRCLKCNAIKQIKSIKGPTKEKIKIETIWSFYPFLPEFLKKISLIEGNTPFLHLKNDKELRGLITKLEFRNPTGSFRDRASALIASHAIMKKAKKIICSSTGSFNISLSAYAAKANIPLISVVPTNLELSKIEQMKVYGSEVIEIGDSVEEAIEYAKSISKNTDSYLATTDNLLIIEGQKTIGLECALYLKDIENVIIPRGSGSLIYSIYRGFEDAIESGWIDSFPSFFSVSLKKTYLDHYAESLKIHKPALNQIIKQILQDTNGKEIEIDAVEMIDEALLLSKKEGLFIEPASASVLAATRTLKNELDINLDQSIAILSGSGLNALNVFASRMRGIKKAVWGLSEKSTTKFEILNLIATQKAKHGYAIWKALEQEQSLQSIYQHLNELEEKNLISSKQITKRRKEFELTKKGIETLNKMRELIDYI